MDIQACTMQLIQFRQGLYQNFNNRADTLMDLVDAMCSNSTARSVVEYSLTPCFRRTHTALYKAVTECRWGEQQLARLLAPYLPHPWQRSFWLLGVDVTPQPDRRGQWRRPSETASDGPRGGGGDHRRATGLWPLGADLLRGVRRPASEAGVGQDYR